MPAILQSINQSLSSDSVTTDDGDCARENWIFYGWKDMIYVLEALFAK